MGDQPSRPVSYEPVSQHQQYHKHPKSRPAYRAYSSQSSQSSHPSLMVYQKSSSLTGSAHISEFNDEQQPYISPEKCKEFPRLAKRSDRLEYYTFHITANLGYMYEHKEDQEYIAKAECFTYHSKLKMNDDVLGIILGFLDFTFNVYDEIDVRDRTGKWCQAEILQLNNENVFIHFIGWNHKWNEWIPKDSQRLLPFGEMTQRKKQIEADPIKLTALLKMGFPEARARIALVSSNNDLADAANRLVF